MYLSLNLIRKVSFMMNTLFTDIRTFYFSILVENFAEPGLFTPTVYVDMCLQAQPAFSVFD